MCRYAFYNYKNTYACFKCQVGFKRRNLYDVNPDATESHEARCPTCGGEVFNIGRDLRVPVKTKDEQWRCIKYLVDQNYNIYSCGCQGIGFVPHKMEDAIELVARKKLEAKQYTYEQAKKEKQEALERKRTKNAQALRTKILVREAKKDGFEPV
jgi:DNA-directed RNA polymerase subunit RPC12/RpoP